MVARRLHKPSGITRAASDGSFNPVTQIGPSGTSALTISSSSENGDGLEAVNWVPETVIDQLAYRSELAGVCGILACLAILVEHFDITSGGITTTHNIEFALMQSEGTWPLNISQPCFEDIHPCTDRFLAYQDNLEMGRRTSRQQYNVALDWWALMNVDMDGLAKEYLASCTNHHASTVHNNGTCT